MQGPPDLLPDILPGEPMTMVAEWLEHAWRVRSQPNPHAIVLATSDADGRPSARVVLCKDIAVAPGYLVFYTNYRSRKGRELERNDRAAAIFFWDALNRQIRVEGRVVKAPAADSDAYFSSRSWDKQLSVFASDQSETIDSRRAMHDKVMAVAGQLGILDREGRLLDTGPAKTIPRPVHWGGYRLWADSVEIWTEGSRRIHDRGLWTRTLGDRDDDHGPWSSTRLQP